MPDLSPPDGSVLLSLTLCTPRLNPYLLLFSFLLFPPFYYYYFLTYMFMIICFALVSLSFPSLINTYHFPDCSFQEVPIGHKSGTCQGVELYSSLRNFCALRRPTKGFLTDLGLRALLHKLPRVIIGSNGW